MLTRQKVILNMIRECGGRMSRMRLVKLAFLFSREADGPSSATYQFLPYRFGPFSFTLYHELEKLIGHEYLRILSQRDLSLSNDCVGDRVLLDDGIAQRVRSIVHDYGGLSLSSLIDLTYSRYPWFTLRSDWRSRRAVQPVAAGCAIYTAGYGGWQVDGFLDLLLRRGIKSLLDVRANPVSRCYGFHRSTLSRICRRLGIQYRHLQEFGVPSDWRAVLNNTGDYERLFARYEAEVLRQREEPLADLGAAMASTPSVLVCYEADPQFCHRSRLAAVLSKQTGLEVHDLNGG